VSSGADNIQTEGGAFPSRMRSPVEALQWGAWRPMAMTSDPGAFFRQNRLLGALPLEALERLAVYFEPVPLALRDVLIRPGEAMSHVYFPLSGILCLVSVMNNNRALETGLVGREGMAPVLAFLGIEQAPQEVVIQASGEALRAPATLLREQAQGPGPFHDLMERYTALTLLHTTQNAACNGLHPVEERLARWLLLAHDRIEGDTLPVSQRLLGLLLGVRQASVTAAGAVLQQAGLIRHEYGRVEILNRAGLEAAACECYLLMRAATERVFASGLPQG
jgi:CRP-like cAMP-binding protein